MRPTASATDTCRQHRSQAAGSWGQNSSGGLQLRPKRYSRFNFCPRKPPKRYEAADRPVRGSSGNLARTGAVDAVRCPSQTAAVARGGAFLGSDGARVVRVGRPIPMAALASPVAPAAAVQAEAKVRNAEARKCASRLATALSASRASRLSRIFKCSSIVLISWVRKKGR